MCIYYVVFPPELQISYSIRMIGIILISPLPTHHSYIHHMNAIYFPLITVDVVQYKLYINLCC